MATLTTAQYLDGGTARTAGEVMTFNGGSLTKTRTLTYSLGVMSGYTDT